MGKPLCHCDSPDWDSEYLGLDDTDIEIWHCWCSNCGAKRREEQSIKSSDN